MRVSLFIARDRSSTQDGQHHAPKLTDSLYLFACMYATNTATDARGREPARVNPRRPRREIPDLVRGNLQEHECQTCGALVYMCVHWICIKLISAPSSRRPQFWISALSTQPDRRASSLGTERSKSECMEDEQPQAYEYAPRRTLTLPNQGMHRSYPPPAKGDRDRREDA